MSDRGGIDALDVLVIGGAAYIVWQWFKTGSVPGLPHFGVAPGTPHNQTPGPVMLTESDLDGEYLFREIPPTGTKPSGDPWVAVAGYETLREGAPKVLTRAGLAPGWRYEPGDAQAATAVQRYALAKAAGQALA